jgi:cysteine-rich repeat protein
LTAGHCVDAAPNAVWFRVAGRWHRAGGWVVHPEHDPDCDPSVNLGLCAFDLAVLHLSTTPAGVAPVPISPNPPLTQQDAQLVGYGYTRADGRFDWTRRIANNDVEQVLLNLFVMIDSGTNEGGTCNGDSGGPTFAVVDGREVLLGVHKAADCTTLSADSRVDRIARRTHDDTPSWIEQNVNGDAVSIAPALEADDPAWFGDPSGRERTWTTLPSAPGRTALGRSWNYAMGYHFTAMQDGTIAGLGGTFTGTKIIRLFDRDTGELLEETYATADGDVYGPVQLGHRRYGYSPISPVPVYEGNRYTAAVYLEGSGGAYRTGMTFPYRLGGVRIDASTYVYTGNAPDRRPTNSTTRYLYGQADVAFVAAFCGDGFVNRNRDRQETCDDGNTVGGDGCSSLCLVE